MSYFTKRTIGRCLLPRRTFSTYNFQRQQSDSVTPSDLVFGSEIKRYKVRQTGTTRIFALGQANGPYFAKGQEEILPKLNEQLQELLQPKGSWRLTRYGNYLKRTFSFVTGDDARVGACGKRFSQLDGDADGHL